MYSLGTGMTEEKHMRIIIDSNDDTNIKGREIGGVPNFPSYLITILRELFTRFRTFEACICTLLAMVVVVLLTFVSACFADFCTYGSQI